MRALSTVAFHLEVVAVLNIGVIVAVLCLGVKVAVLLLGVEDS